MKLIHLSCLLGLSVLAHAEAPKFELRDGDRVLLLGDALLERENTLGYLEARMHAAWPQTKFTVRNLSWAGDTPKGWSRASFDGPAKGYERLKEQIALVKPTVVFLGYGMAASLQEMTDRSNDIMLNRDTARYGEEPMTAARFKKELGELMTDIEAGGDKPRFVLMSPIKHEDLRATRPGTVDPTKHNELIEAYSKGIEELAKERGARFVDLAQIPYYPHDNPPKTLDGIHLAEAGHLTLAKHNVTGSLGWADGTDSYATLEETTKSPLTAAILKKNDLFFHRTRPANSTYIFGFRKHEQGRNAVEIPQYDPLVDKVDAEIDALKRSGSAEKSHGGTVPPQGSTVPPQGGTVPPQSSAAAPQGGTVQPHGGAVPPQGRAAQPHGRTVQPQGSNVPPQGGIATQPLPIPAFTMEEGYEITLWADTNLVGKPVGMNWDAAGRLWVACSPVYPMIAPGAHPEDKVVVIEDTDHDGKADKSTTFATNLLIAAGVAPDFSNAETGSRSEERKAASGVAAAEGKDSAQKLFVEEFLKIRKAEDMEKAGDYEGALKAFRESESQLKKIKEQWPNWQPDILVLRLSKIEQAIQRLSKAIQEKSPGADKSAESNDATPHPASRIAHPASVPNAAYVGSSTELVHVTDTDGDGVADQRRVVLSGFGTEDTHHTLHTLKCGPDGRLFFNQSIYIHSHLETPYGMVRVNSGAIMAYDPRTERTEVIAKGWCNPWGHVWDEWGQQFTTDGAGGQGISWLVQGAMYFTYENAKKIMPSISPGSYPKFCGLELVRSPLFPAEWQGNAITCDFRAHRIVRFSFKDLSPAKSGYETKAEPDLVRTTDSSFRPIDVKMGPDGALYVADWTNPVINHGEVDFRDPRRDHVNGRIWRIAPKGKAPIKWESLVGKKVEELAGALSSKNHWEASASSAVFDEVTKQSGDEQRRKQSDTAKITLKLKSIIIPKIELNESTVPAAIEFLIKQSKELDTDKEGVNIVLKTAPGADPAQATVGGGTRITLALNNVPLLEALKYVTALANLKYRIDPLAVTIVPIGTTTGPEMPTKEWKVRPEFLTRIPSTSKTARDKLFQAGVNFPPGAIAIYSKSTRTLTVKNSGENLERIEEIIESLEHISGGTQVSIYQRAIRDTNPRVRLEAMRALSRIPTDESAALVLEAAVNGASADALPATPGGQFVNSTAAENADTHYAYAAWLSVNDLAPQVIQWIEANANETGRASFQPALPGFPPALPGALRDAMIAFALQSLPSAKTGPLLSKIVAKNGAPKDGPWIELIGQSGGPAEAEKLIAQIAEPRAAAALIAAARRGVKPPGASLDVIKSAPAAVKADALRLAGLWKLDAVDFITAAMNGASQPVIDASFEALATLRTPAAKKELETLLAKPDAGLRRRALESLAGFAPDAALASLAVVAADGDDAAKLALFRSLFASEVFKGKFAAAVPKDLPKPAIAAALRASRELGRKGEALTNALTQAMGAEAPVATVDMPALVKAAERGNPMEGEAIYRRLALACTACHAIGGAGGKVGPELMTIGASAPVDYIVESLFVPNAKVKEGYNAIALTLKGGRAASGVLLRETAEAVFLRDAAGNETSVPKGDITARENVGSIMPAGLINALPDKEKASLVAFLSQLGKPGPFDATKANIARVWWLYPGKDVEAVVSGKITTPGAKTLTNVDGRLPKAALTDALQMVPEPGDMVVAVAKFAGAGKTRLNLQGVTKAYLDGAPLAIASNPSPEVELTAGNHTLVVKLDTKQLPENLRAECPEGRFVTE